MLNINKQLLPIVDKYYVIITFNEIFETILSKRICSDITSVEGKFIQYLYYLPYVTKHGNKNHVINWSVFTEISFF